MAKRLQGKDLQEFRNAAGNFQERSTAIVDEGGRISECSFAELLPALGTIKRLVVFGDREQGGPFSSKSKRLPCLLTLLEKRRSSILETW